MSGELSDINRLKEIVTEGCAAQLLAFFREDPYIPDAFLDRMLTAAVHRGDTTIIRILLAAGADITRADQQQLLARAVHENHMDVIKMLIKEGIDIENTVETDLCQSPLQIAISYNNQDMIDFLLSCGMTLLGKDCDGGVSLHTAALMNVECVLKILKAGCDVNVQRTSDGYTPLHLAVENSMLSVVRVLLNHGAEMGLQDTVLENTPLHIAANQNDKEVIQLCLDQMAKEKSDLEILDRKNILSQTCVHLAARQGSFDLVNLLTMAGAKLDGLDENGDMPVLCAIQNRQVDCALKILDFMPMDLFQEQVIWANKLGNGILHLAAAVPRGISILEKIQQKQCLGDPDVVNNNKETPLMIGSIHGNEPVVRLLMNLHADVNRASSDYCSPLHAAFANDHLDLVMLILTSGKVCFDNLDPVGETVLHKVSHSKNSFIMEASLSKGISSDIINQQSLSGNTALHFLMEKSCDTVSKEIICEMIKSGADVNLLNNDGDSPLMCAAKIHADNAINIEPVLLNGALVNLRDKENGKTPLHYACELNKTKTVLLLLENGADCNIQNTSNNTPLHFAISPGNDYVILTMLQKGCNLDIIGQNGQTALHHAARHGLSATVSSFLENGAKPDVPGAQVSPLILAAKKGCSDIVRMLLEQGADVNKQNSDGRTALMWATQEGNSDCVTYLLQYGADPLLTDGSGDTALTIASWEGRTESLRLILSASTSNINQRESEEYMTALQLAIGKGHKDCVQALLQAGADINVCDYRGNTALLTAAMLTTGNDILQMVVDSGQKFIVDKVGYSEMKRSALHWCVSEPDSVATLLPHKPDLDMLDGNGASPLLLAIAHGQSKSAKLLIEAGCDVNLVHLDGRSPIHHAAVYGDLSTTQLLIDRGVSADTPMSDGRRPLLLAAIDNHPDVMLCLLQNHAEVNHVYDDSVTALSIAVSRNFDPCVKLLLDFGADPDLIGSKKNSPILCAVLTNYIFGLLSLVQAGAKVDLELTEHPLYLAGVKNHTLIMRILLEIGCDPNCVQAILKDGTIFYYLKDDRLIELMKEAAKKPRSLATLSRDVLRQHLHRPLVASVENMKLPNRLRDYIVYADLFDKQWEMLVDLEG